jgi:hypothetical protein
MVINTEIRVSIKSFTAPREDNQGALFVNRAQSLLCEYEGAVVYAHVRGFSQRIILENIAEYTRLPKRAVICEDGLTAGGYLIFGQLENLVFDSAKGEVSFANHARNYRCSCRDLFEGAEMIAADCL